MSTNKFAEMPDEKIIQLEKSIKGIVIVFSVAMIIIVVTCVYATIKKGFSGLSTMPIAFIPIYMLNLNSLSRIKKEKKLRNL